MSPFLSGAVKALDGPALGWSGAGLFGLDDAMDGLTSYGIEAGYGDEAGCGSGKGSADGIGTEDGYGYAYGFAEGSSSTVGDGRGRGVPRQGSGSLNGSGEG